MLSTSTSYTNTRTIKREKLTIIQLYDKSLRKVSKFNCSALITIFSKTPT